MKLIDFEITTPERTAFKAKVRQATLPTVGGEITVLPDHVPLVAPVLAGELRALDEAGNEILMAVSGGFVTVQPDGKVTVLADTAERAEELEVEAVEAAKRRAEEALKERIVDEERFADAAAHLARELARLKVARKHRAKGGGRVPLGTEQE
jgi:F-type H+-transporting ATPase subunit epsilon